MCHDICQMPSKCPYKYYFRRAARPGAKHSFPSSRRLGTWGAAVGRCSSVQASAAGASSRSSAASVTPQQFVGRWQARARRYAAPRVSQLTSRAMVGVAHLRSGLAAMSRARPCEPCPSPPAAAARAPRRSRGSAAPPPRCPRRRSARRTSYSGTRRGGRCRRRGWTRSRPARTTFSIFTWPTPRSVAALWAGRSRTATCCSACSPRYGRMSLCVATGSAGLGGGGRLVGLRGSCARRCVVCRTLRSEDGLISCS